MADDPSYKTPDPMILEGNLESSLQDVPGRFLADLLGGAKDASDPATRDYGERYSYKEVIGEGGQGVVISAEDKLLEREVAIKALKAPMDPDREEILEHEAKICGILEHPNILPTYDLCHDETGSPFFVMKKIEGVSLEGLLRASHTSTNDLPRGWDKQEDYSTRRLLSIFLQVCHAIDYAHSRGVYHLDLKPQNIKLGSHGEVYVLDWGFAARKEEDTKYIAGTPIYIAPERMKGQRPDASSDIYSLGVILYRILTGKLPRNISKITFREYRDRFEEFPIVPPRERNSSVPRELAAIILKAMSENPSERYASAAGLARDIESFLDLMPVSAYREGILGRSKKFIQRHMAASALVTVSITATIIVGVISYMNHLTENKARILQAEAEERARKERLRMLARIPFEKAQDMIIRRRDKVSASSDADEKMKILAPVFELYGKAIAIDPEFALAYYERGKAYEQARVTNKALADFATTLELDKSYIMAHYYRGRIFSDMKRHENALKEFKAMTADSNTDNEYAQLGRAYVALAQNKYDEALRLCKHIEEMNPNLSDVWYIRGEVYQKSPEHGSLDDARRAYGEFLSRRQDTPSAFLNRAAIWGAQGKYEEAVKDYRAALSIQPNYKWALSDLGYTLAVHMENYQEGLKYLSRAVEIDPNDAYRYLPRAAVYELIQNWGKARADYEKAVYLEPKSWNTRYRLGIFYYHTLEMAKAERELTECIRLSPADSYVRYHRRGIVRLARQNYAGAIADFEEAIRIKKKETIYPTLMRWIAFKLQNGEPIDIRDFESHLGAPPDKPWLAAVGSYYLGEIKEEEVIKLAATPKAQCEVYFYLGASHMIAKDLKKADYYFTKTISTGSHLDMEYTLARLYQKRLLEDNAKSDINKNVKTGEEQPAAHKDK